MQIQDEEWRPIADFPAYAVSSLGRIKRLTDSPSGNFKAGHVLSTKRRSNGYPSVILRDGERLADKHVHALVCEAFHGKRPFKNAEVRHLDGTRYNNQVNNLKWGSAQENANDRVLHGVTNKGRIVSLETREKQRKAKLGRQLSEETKARIGNTQRGIPKKRKGAQ